MNESHRHSNEEQVNYECEMMKLYRVCKKWSVHDALSDLLGLCEEFQRLDSEEMDRMTGREQYRCC